MNMVGIRNYYIPRNCIGRQVMNTIVERVGCSVSDFRLNKSSNTIKFTVTCELKDFSKIEKLLRRYGMLEG